MPGATNNNNLLSGLNQLIHSINELTSATSSQTLSPTVNVSAPDVTVVNDVPVPSITVDPTPITNNVTFDVTALATELASIKDNLQDIMGDTDALAGLNNLVDMVTNMGTGNIRLAEIRDRLANDGDNIATAIRESKATVSKIVDLATSSAGMVNAIKCTNAKTYIGYVSQQLRLAKENAVWQSSIGTNVLDIFSEWYKGTIVATADIYGVTEGLASGIVSLLNIWQEISIADFDTLVGEFETYKEAFVCCIYEGASPQDALKNMRDRISLSFTPEYLIMAGMEEIFISSSDMLARIFTNQITQTEIDRYAAWSSFDCGTCADAPGGCQATSNYVVQGQTGINPLFLNGEPVYGQTIRVVSTLAGGDTNHKIKLQFQNVENVQIIAQTDGAQTAFSWLDCNDNVCASLSGQTNADFPLNGDCVSFQAERTDTTAEFYLDLVLSVGDGPMDCSGSTWDYSCFPRSGWMTAGVGTLFTGGVWTDPIGTWRTITSGVFAGNSQAIYFHPDNTYEIEIEILTMTGANVNVSVEDCANAELYNQNYVSPGNAGIHQGEIIKLFGGINSDTFTARFRRIT